MSVPVFVTSPNTPSAAEYKAKPQQPLNDVILAVRSLIDTADAANNELKPFHTDSGRWLPVDSKETLLSFDLCRGGRLDFRNPKRFAKVRLLDGSTKTVYIDETKMVKDIVCDICKQFDVDYPEELSLVVAGDYNQETVSGRKFSSSPFGTISGKQSSPVAGRSLFQSPLVSVGTPPLLRRPSPKLEKNRLSLTMPRQMSRDHNDSPTTTSPQNLSPGLSPTTGAKSPRMRRRSMPRSPGPDSRSSRQNSFPAFSGSPNLRRSAKAAKAVKLRKQMSRKHGFRLNTPWLAPDLSLFDQFVSEDDDLLLMYRFFYSMTITPNTRRVDLLYTQARNRFVSAELPCNEDDIIQFVAFQLQCNDGDHNDRFNMEWLQSKRDNVLPSKFKLKDSTAQLIIDEHKRLAGITPGECKCLFVQLWSSLSMFGHEFLSCAEVQSKRKGLIGVSKSMVTFIPHSSSKKGLKLPLSSLKTWTHLEEKEVVRLTFPNTTLQLLLPDYSGVLADCLQGHLDMQSGPFKMIDNELNPQFTILSTDGDLSEAAERLREKLDGGQLVKDKTLTFDEVLFSDRVINPLVSEEELEDMNNPGLWHNPAYSNMENLVDERFAFLDELVDGDGSMDEPDGALADHFAKSLDSGKPISPLAVLETKKTKKKKRQREETLGEMLVSMGIDDSCVGDHGNDSDLLDTPEDESAGGSGRPGLEDLLYG